MKCKCGGELVTGYMYDGQFVAGECDLKRAFRGCEHLLSSRYPNGIPEKGKKAEMCSACYTLYDSSDASDC